MRKTKPHSNYLFGFFNPKTGKAWTETERAQVRRELREAELERERRREDADKPRRRSYDPPREGRWGYD